MPAIPGAAFPGPEGWTVAEQHERGRNILSAAPLVPVPGDAQASLLALRHQSGDLYVQGHLFRSQNEGRASDAQGYWLDTDWREGPRQHGVSLYRLDPGLNWAGLAMPSDVQGITLRSQWRSRQWSADGSYDLLKSVSGRTGDGHYVSGGVRRRLDRSQQISAGFSVRHFDGHAWTGYGDWRLQNDWGSSGLRLTLTGGSRRQDPVRKITWDQEWLVPQGWALSSSLGLGRYASNDDGTPGDSAGSAALSFTIPVSSMSSLRGSLGTERRSNGQRSHSMNLGGQWRLHRNWSAEINLTRHVGQYPVGPSLDPLAPVINDPLTSSSRSLYLVLRYDIQAGSRSVPLGGRPTEGGGTIEGIVYFDANRSGTQDASESGAPGVTVYLDNRYAVRTDARGRFQFPFVASGPRTVSVRNETLPLPWGVVGDGQSTVEVNLRETSQLSIPVQRSD